MHLPPSLHRAVKQGNTEEILRILAPLNPSLQQVFAGRYARHLAMEGHEEVISYLYRTGLTLDDKDDQGAGVLHYAAYKGHLNIVRYLHEQGADIHTQDNAGMTLLHAAAIRGEPALVRYLCEHGVEVDATNGVGQTALHLAGVTMMLRRIAYPQDPPTDHFQVINYLQTQGADIEAVDAEGRKAKEFITMWLSKQPG